MKRINFISDVLPHAIAIAVFLVITFLFFNPVFFENKVISQPDVQMWSGPSKSLRDYREATGEEALWVPTMFSGMPAYLVSVVWSNEPVVFFKKVLTLWLPHGINNIFLAFVSYYILLLAFNVRPYLAIAGALAFGLSSFMIIGVSAGHNTRIGATALMPLVVAGIHFIFKGKRVLGFGIASLGFALHLRENHVQVTYYLFMIIGVYALVQLIEAFRNKTISGFAKNTGIFIVALIFAVGPFVGQFWSLSEYSQYSIRGKSEIVAPFSVAKKGLSKEYAFEYSNGIGEPMTLLIPNIYGGSTANYLVQNRESRTYQALANSGDEQTANQLASYSSAYWGGQKNTAPYYAGAIVCFLFVIGIFFAERKYIWWLLPLSIFSIILTWGSNFAWFNYFLFDYLPGYNKFRSVTFALSIILFAMPLLGMLGLENLLQSGWSKLTQRKLWWSLGLTGGLCFILALTGGFGSFLQPEEADLPSWFTTALKQDRKSLLRSDAWRSFWLIFIFAGVVFARLKNWIKDPVLILASIILIAFDLSMVDSRFIDKNNYQRKREANFTSNEADTEILKDKSYYRVYNLQGAFSEARTSYFHNSIGGYHGAKLRRYQDLYDSCISQETQQLFKDAQSNNFKFENYGTINMLNVKYIVYGPTRQHIMPNPAANGPAWFVQEIVKVNSPTEELSKTCDINTKQSAVIDISQMEVPAFSYDSASTIQLLENTPKHMKYQSEAVAPGVAVFSEVYYPKGWKATIDGQPVSILRANYVLRAIAIPAGKHIIEFKFEPDAYVIGNKISMVSSWLLLIVVIGCFGWSIKKHP